MKDFAHNELNNTVLGAEENKQKGETFVVALIAWWYNKNRLCFQISRWCAVVN